MSDGPAGAPPLVARVLVAEDEPHLGTLLEQFLLGRGHRVTLVRDGRAALAALQAQEFDVALTDVQMPGPDGLALLAAARALPLGPEVVVVTGNGAADTQLRALRAGAYDAVAKPYRMAEVELLVQRAAEKRAMRRALAAGEALEALRAPVADPLLETLADRLLAAPDAPALLVGEPGTGRRTLARLLHTRAGRRGPFVVVRADAAAQPASHALAYAGTLCVVDAERLEDAALDALPTGGTPAVVAVATSRRAWAARFGDRAVELPPLRARAADVPALASAMAERAAGRPIALEPEAEAWLVARAWPGNVAELRAVIEGAVARAGDAAALPARAFDVGG